MKNIPSKLLLILLTSVLLSAKSYANDSVSPCLSLAPIDWLIGSWQESNNKTIITEKWQRVSDNTLEGLGETVYLDKETKFIETLRIVAMGDGVFYLAKIPNNPLPVAFKLIKCESGIAEFENERHDFPQRLRYIATDNQHLTVEISSKENKGFELHFTRIIHEP